MFPKINYNIMEIEDSKPITLGKCFKFDFQKGRHIIIDGKFVECDFQENIRQFIQVILRTKINTFKVYTIDDDENFGLSIHNYMGNKVYHKGFILSETKREITEQLLNHPFIKDVDNFKFEFENTFLNITFTCFLHNHEILNINEVVELEF
ncbi:DUF2634 domain-containing protein [[Clostridium] colinum]|uniref:DUF2634 domain-containing protein n=1 Tax=[Clostridium] colinum TaxID=36835 RepID=UPI0020251EC3|nr:DUF2634 domain-containing protein [[Clostridium] colinum]